MLFAVGIRDLVFSASGRAATEERSRPMSGNGVKYPATINWGGSSEINDVQSIVRNTFLLVLPMVPRTIAGARADIREHIAGRAEI